MIPVRFYGGEVYALSRTNRLQLQLLRDRWGERFLERPNQPLSQHLAPSLKNKRLALLPETRSDR